MIGVKHSSSLSLHADRPYRRGLMMSITGKILMATTSLRPTTSRDRPTVGPVSARDTIGAAQWQKNSIKMHFPPLFP